MSQLFYRDPVTGEMKPAVTVGRQKVFPVNTATTHEQIRQALNKGKLCFFFNGGAVAPMVSSVGGIFVFRQEDRDSTGKAVEWVITPTTPWRRVPLDGNFATKSDLADVAKTIPNVPEWAMSPRKPTYTAQEVGAQPKGDYASKADVEGKLDAPTTPGKPGEFLSAEGKWATPKGGEGKQVFTATITKEGDQLVCDMTASQIIDADRKGVVKARYTDETSRETRIYYYAKQTDDGRAVFSKDGYIEEGTVKQALIIVDYAGNVTVETQTAEGGASSADNVTATVPSGITAEGNVQSVLDALATELSGVSALVGGGIV